MSKILITGNGFDLFHGLPTKYGHFMAVMETIEKYDFKPEVTFEHLFENLFKERFPGDYELIKENFFTEKIFFENEKILKVSKLLDANAWYKHFKKILEIDTWIDFENEIERLLLDISSIFSELKRNSKNFNFYSKDKINVYNDLSSFEFIGENHQIEVIIKRDFLNIHNKTVKEKLILENLAKELEIFTEIFNLYLSVCVNSFYVNRKIIPKIPIEMIDKIFTFNYTPTIEKFYKTDNSKIVYLHGKTNEDINIQNLVLGINEIPNEIKAHKMFDFTKYYQKINKKSNPKFIDVPKQKVNTINETIFYIIGHSLDESDKLYIQDLFNFLDYDLGKNSKICVFYYNSKDKENKLRNLFSVLKDKEVIIEMEKEKRLYFVELTLENINKEFVKTLYNISNEFGISIR